MTELFSSFGPKSEELLAVYCDDPAHAGAPFQLGSFRHPDSQRIGLRRWEWRYSYPNSPDPTILTGQGVPTRLRGQASEPAEAELLGSDLIEGPKSLDVYRDPELRRKPEIVCKAKIRAELADATYTVRVCGSGLRKRMDVIELALDALWDQGQRRVSLDTLRSVIEEMSR